MIEVIDDLLYTVLCKNCGARLKFKFSDTVVATDDPDSKRSVQCPRCSTFTVLLQSSVHSISDSHLLNAASRHVVVEGLNFEQVATIGHPEWKEVWEQNPSLVRIVRDSSVVILSKDRFETLLKTLNDFIKGNLVAPPFFLKPHPLSPEEILELFEEDLRGNQVSIPPDIAAAVTENYEELLA
jgi:hypothetical protein